SEYQLLTQFNPAFINKKIKMCEFQIESMYHMSASTTTCDEIMGVVSVSYPIEKLVIKIIETKAGLQNYKNRSINNMALLKKGTKSLYRKRAEASCKIYAFKWTI
ncbi:hypothetical protein U094_00282, partial [Staphylococcus aureus DAR5876]